MLCLRVLWTAESHTAQTVWPKNLQSCWRRKMSRAQWLANRFLRKKTMKREGHFFRINRPCGCRASCSNSTSRRFFLNPDVTLAGICFLFSFDCKWRVLLLLMSFLHSSGSSLVLACEINCKERKRCNHTVFNKCSSTKTYFKLPVVVQWLVLFLDRLFFSARAENLFIWDQFSWAVELLAQQRSCFV